MHRQESGLDCLLAGLAERGAPLHTTAIRCLISATLRRAAEKGVANQGGVVGESEIKDETKQDRESQKEIQTSLRSSFTTTDTAHLNLQRPFHYLML